MVIKKMPSRSAGMLEGEQSAAVNGWLKVVVAYHQLYFHVFNGLLKEVEQAELGIA